MRIKKKDGDFNYYTIEDVSYGELVALERAMAAKHDDALTDEIYSTLRWYLDELPKPGEKKEDDEDSDSGTPPEDDDFEQTGEGEGDVEETPNAKPAPMPPKLGEPDEEEPEGGTAEHEQTADDESPDDYLEAPPR